MTFVDTHAHLDGEEFRDDLPEVIARARGADVGAIFLPAINAESLITIPQTCSQYPDYLYPMMGLQPEEVKADWREVLDKMHAALLENSANSASNSSSAHQHPSLGEALDRKNAFIAIGECGLDFYWSREFEQEQLAAFEEQVRWSVELQLPLMIHCRKAQNELLRIMKPYEDDLPGGVFHCFTGNRQEAEEYLRFDRFCLGIGGVSTFKSSHLREDLPAAVPLDRIVLETDSPYMAPVPHRGQRNESAFVRLVLENLARCYNVTADEVAAVTDANVKRVFGVTVKGI